MSLRNEDISCNNSCIMCELKVPMQNKKAKRLANIFDENNYRFGLKKFYYFGHKHFIDVKAIKRCVG
ncbi:7621_t:CDS:2, partial [Dentiscutata erythropus]